MITFISFANCVKIKKLKKVKDKTWLIMSQYECKILQRMILV